MTRVAKRRQRSRVARLERLRRGEAGVGIGASLEQPFEAAAAAARVIGDAIVGQRVCRETGRSGGLVACAGVRSAPASRGTNAIVDGVSIYVTSGAAVSRPPESLPWIGGWTNMGVLAGVRLFLFVAGLVGVVFRRTPFGLSMDRIGSNRPATRPSGVDTRRTLIGACTLSSQLGFCAAVLMPARVNAASADYAESDLLVAVLAAVLGGVDRDGGFGRIAGVMLALFALQARSSGSNRLAFRQPLTLAIWGATLVGAVAARVIGPGLTAERSRGDAPRRAGR